MTTDVTEDNNKIMYSAIDCVFKRQDLATGTNLLDEMIRPGDITNRESSVEPVGKKDTFRGIVNNVSNVEVHNT